MQVGEREEENDEVRDERRMPPLLFPCSVCSATLSKHIFRDVEDPDRICRFCDLDSRVDEVLDALRGQRKEEDGGLAAKVFVLEHQLRTVGGELTEMREETGRVRELAEATRVVVSQVQQDLLCTKRELEVFAATLSRNLRSDVEKASKGLAETTQKLAKVSELVVHASQLDEEA